MENGLEKVYMEEKKTGENKNMQHTVANHSVPERHPNDPQRGSLQWSHFPAYYVDPTLPIQGKDLE